MGHDFSDVRVHTGDAADASARSVSAHAYTVGSNIVFQRGTYDPGSSQGQTLLAHELTHVVQQRSGPVDGTPAAGGVSVSDPSDRFEREAARERRARDAAAGARRTSVGRGGGGPAVQASQDPRSASSARARRRKRCRPPTTPRWPGAARGRRGGGGGGLSARPLSAPDIAPGHAAGPIGDRLAEGTRPRPAASPAGRRPRPARAAARRRQLRGQRPAGRQAQVVGRRVADIDKALREVRGSEPDVGIVEKGLKATKAAGVQVDLEGEANKPPASALAVVKTGFGPATVAPKKPVPPPKPVKPVSPLGKAGAKAPKPAGRQGRGPPAVKAPAIGGGGAPRGPGGPRAVVGRQAAPATGRAAGLAAGGGPGVRAGEGQRQGFR